MYDPKMRPLAVMYGYVADQNKTTFLGRKEKVSFTANSDLITAILKHCNGRNTIREIRSEIEVDQPLFDRTVCALIDHRIIVDGCNLHSVFHEDSSNPMMFRHNLRTGEVQAIQKRPRRIVVGKSRTLPQANGNLLSLIRSRKSTRNFRGGTLHEQVLSGLLESMYGTKKTWSVPSGGAMYSLRLYLVLLRDIEPLPKGVYCYDSDGRSLVEVGRCEDEQRIAWLLDSESVIKNAIGVIFVTADIDKPASKYANRAYRLVLLEAGHVAQNAYLYCVEAGIGVVEWAGFRDQAVAQFLQLQTPDEIVVTSLVFGLPARTPVATSVETASTTFEEAFVGAEKIVTSLRIQELRYAEYIAPFAFATARYRPWNQYATDETIRRSISFGRGASVAEAKLKAIAEALERYASGVVRLDLLAPEQELDTSVFDLCKSAPIRHDYVSKHRDAQRRNGNTVWGWVAGYRLSTQERVYVPVDQVFYPLDRRNIPHATNYLANSSGVAIHSERNSAIKNAVLELVERDAIATLWYGKRIVFKIPHEHASIDSVRNRVLFWRTASKKVEFLNVTTDTVPVVLVIIHGPGRPYLACGAAAAGSFAVAAHKAFEEAEAMLLSWQHATNPSIDPKKVMSVREHGQLYFDDKYISVLNWLLYAQEREPDAPSCNEVDALRIVDPVIVDITPKALKEQCSLPIMVVRALSERLMPLTFGYGNEHFDHPRLQMLSCEWAWKYPAFPHFFS